MTEPANRSESPFDGDPRMPLGQHGEGCGSPEMGNCEEWDQQHFLECCQANAAGLRVALAQRLKNPADVDDCLNRVWEKLWLHGGAVAEGARRAWLFVVARNEVAAFYRRDARGPRQRGGRSPEWMGEVRERADFEYRRTDPWEELVDDLPAPDQRLQHDEEQEQLRLAMHALPPDQAEVIRCRFHEGMTFQKIAEHLGIPLGTALSRARAALLKLRRELER